MAKASLTATDFEALVAEVNEARAILKRKDELEREIRSAERQFAALTTKALELAELRDAIEADIRAGRDRFEHEKARYSTELAAHVKTCEERKAVVEKEYAAARVGLATDLAAVHDSVAGQTRDLEKQVSGLVATRDALKKEIQDFRARIALLG